MQFYLSFEWRINYNRWLEMSCKSYIVLRVKYEDL